MLKNVFLRWLATSQAVFFLIMIVAAVTSEKRTAMISGLMSTLPIAIYCAICWVFIYRKYSREKLRGNTNEERGQVSKPDNNLDHS